MSTINIDNIAGTAEVAECLECPKQQIHALRKNTQFPAPIKNIGATPLWNLDDIKVFKESWKRKGKRTPKVSSLEISGTGNVTVDSSYLSTETPSTF